MFPGVSVVGAAQQSVRRHTMRLAFSAAYFGSWIITTALLLFAPIALLWGMANVSQLTGVDDDVTLLALPMGAALGAWAAVRTRRAAAIHGVFSILGVCFTVSGIALAYWSMQRSQQASGSGPFAGFGELVVAGTSIGIAALGVCMFGIWAFARLAGLHDSGESRIEPISTNDA
jgi:hypothetical protein